jgi:deoxyribodipyrimidine photo-lyase
MPAILWFRADLRLADNDALAAASAGGRPVLPVYIHDRAAMGGRGGRGGGG